MCNVAGSDHYNQTIDTDWTTLVSYNIYIIRSRSLRSVALIYAVAFFVAVMYDTTQ